MAADPVALCAEGEAAWHAAAYRGLRATWTYADGIAHGVPPHRFLLGAVTLAPRPALPVGLAGELRDCWGALRPAELPGWTRTSADPWMHRSPGAYQPPPVAGVEIVRTRDELLFERIAFLGASGRLPGSPGELHPAGSAAQPGLQLFLAYCGGRPVGTSLAVVHERGVTVSAVAVEAAHRRRGIGALLTMAAVRAAPDRPATLAASELGSGAYRTCGFVEVGRGADWQPPR